MTNLKLDLLNKLRNDKYYAEIELGRLAADPTMNYQWKIDAMKVQLQDIALLNSEIDLVGQYFVEQPQVAPADAPQAQPPQPQVAPQPQGQVHQGQSHGE